MRRKIQIAITVVVCAVALWMGISAGLKLYNILRIPEPPEVADYDSRILIWNTVAGNSNESKLADMNYDSRARYPSGTSSFNGAIHGESYRDNERNIDTTTYAYEIRDGYESEFYDDEPYIIPYVVPDSVGSIIIIPGGGYAFVSTERSTAEGRDIALTLNEYGISAFVLHYRSNPYEYPVPQLDVQRAVRYIRYNAEELGVNPDNIGLIGFSAGGFQVGSFINLIMNQDVFPEDYEPDEIDMVSDSVDVAGLIYPVMTFRYNVPMLFALFDDELVRDDVYREDLLQLTDLHEHITSGSVHQFLAYGTGDGLVNIEGTREYISCALSLGVPVSDVVVQDYGHGFPMSLYIPQFVEMISEVW